MKQDEGFGLWVWSMAEVVNVTIGTEAADDGGAWRSVDVEALVPHRDFAVVADADAGLLAPDVGPPGAVWSGADDGVFFCEGLLVGGMGCHAEFAMDFVLVGVWDEWVKQLV